MRTDEPAADEVAAADARFAEWMRLNLARAARHFGVDVDGEPTYGWRLRTIGAPVNGPAGRRWLRVVSEFPEYAAGDTWTGNSDANDLTGVPRARVLDVDEWTEADWRRQRAELMTLLPGQTVSAADDLQHDPGLPETWWTGLAAALGALHRTKTSRSGINVERTRERTQRVYGTPIGVDTWATIHGDLHWANVFAPLLGILDWEFWGRGPAGYDEATLFLFSLHIPAAAERVRAAFGEILDSPAGRTAQLIAAARLKDRIDDGDFPELADALSAHVDQLRSPFIGQRTVQG
ncbi:hypothetical protein ACFV9C_43910 [Kribbella sp. NPDC059898]|uniref:hypothetical protein n=1 Tax=Kribbella sp. NPDC059898 TaxID=3346995 RepID=UPI003668E77A